MSNLWEKDKKRLFKELYHQYLDEGYTSKEAKKIATEESDEIYSESEDFAYSLASSEDRDDT
jgi:hypothetical protein|tara:strand:- start:8274 stop:8459 length:186 start_codon:yes stop_codon:yes gene_type:complete